MLNLVFLSISIEVLCVWGGGGEKGGVVVLCVFLLLLLFGGVVSINVFFVKLFLQRSEFNSCLENGV